MARFDIYKYENPKVSFVVEIQADLLEDLNTVVVVPLVSIEEHTAALFERLTPILIIENKEYVLVTTDLGTVKRKSLGHCVGNIAKEHEYTITNAIDFLFQGF